MSREHIAGIHLQEFCTSYQEWVPTWTAHFLNSTDVVKVPNEAKAITTPLSTKNWARLLADHPHRQLIQFFISHGFWIGFKQPPKHLKSVKRKLGCALDHPETV